MHGEYGIFLAIGVSKNKQWVASQSNILEAKYSQKYAIALRTTKKIQTADFDIQFVFATEFLFFSLQRLLYIMVLISIINVCGIFLAAVWWCFSQSTFAFLSSSLLQAMENRAHLKHPVENRCRIAWKKWTTFFFFNHGIYRFSIIIIDYLDVMAN